VIALLLIAALAQNPPHIEVRRQIAEELEKHPEPALETRADLDAVNRALQSPERLWRFVTGPETPWAGRMIAAQRGTLPLSYLSRFAAADRELAAEDAEHHWGMDRFVPRYSQMGYMAASPYRGRHKRRVLGHDWTMADGVIDEPLTYDEWVEAPWPWQVERALAVLKAKFFDLQHPAEFWDATLSLPRETVVEAAYFYWMTEQFATMLRRIDPRIIQAWRELGLREGDFLSLHGPLSYAFEPIELAKGGDESRYGEVMMADWAEHWPQREIVTLAVHLRNLNAPPVATEVLARRIDGLGVEDVSARGYAARNFLEAVEPTIVPPWRQNPNDPELLEQTWSVFREWYGRHYAAIAEAALAHAKLLNRYR